MQGLTAPAALGELRGLWRRSLLRYADGRSDTTTRVHWLQGERAYIDLSRPADGTDIAHGRKLNALSAFDCAQLARQEGFAGTLARRGAHFEWTRVIDYQPKADRADAGSLHWEGELLIEHGRDIDYLEHWHRETTEADRSPVAALALRDAESGVYGALLRVGPHFMYARDRARAAPANRNLSECVAAAGSLDEARALVDCEISFGTLGTNEWRITASTLPYRVGAMLKPVIEDHHAATTDCTPDGVSVERAWQIAGVEGALSAWQER